MIGMHVWITLKGNDDLEETREGRWKIQQGLEKMLIGADIADGAKVEGPVEIDSIECYD